MGPLYIMYVIYIYNICYILKLEFNLIYKLNSYDKHIRHFIIDYQQNSQ